MEQVVQECQICLETQQVINFVGICQDHRHVACVDCFTNFEDKSICCYCRQINPFWEPNEISYNSTSYDNSDLASESEFEEYNLFRVDGDMLQFNIDVTSRQALLDAIFVLHQLLGNMVQTRSLRSRLDRFI